MVDVVMLEVFCAGVSIAGVMSWMNRATSGLVMGGRVVKGFFLIGCAVENATGCAGGCPDEGDE
ncbi:hypothetical protein AO262_23610 [Pseudomonas fluorescens ABAC62]|nr:hypothetical protein AO262_23610 [Pseudomonas fluorescens ABAC62]